MTLLLARFNSKSEQQHAELPNGKTIKSVDPHPATTLGESKGIKHSWLRVRIKGSRSKIVPLSLSSNKPRGSPNLGTSCARRAPFL